MVYSAVSDTTQALAEPAWRKWRKHLAKLKLRRLAPPRRLASDLVDLAGLGCLDGAAWWIHPIAGLAVAGAMLLLVGWAVDR